MLNIKCRSLCKTLPGKILKCIKLDFLYPNHRNDIAIFTFVVYAFKGNFKYHYN